MKSTLENTTPASMIPQSVDMAISTPLQIDLAQVVAMLMAKEAKQGTAISTKRGNQTVFYTVCQTLKSLRGLPKDARIDDETANEIRKCIAKQASGFLQDVVNDGYQLTQGRIGFGKIEFAQDGTVHANMAASATWEKHSTLGEYRLNVQLGLTKANEKLVKMLDNPSKYDNFMIQAQKRKIALLEKAVTLQAVPDAGSMAL